MGRKYLRLYYEELAASEAWKKLDAKARAHALYDLCQSVMDGGGVPSMWKRVADLRSIGEKWKPARKVESRYAPFQKVWEEAWLEARLEPWIWDGKQRGILQRIYTLAGGDVALFRARVERLFGHKSPWWRENASLALLDGRWNELVGGRPARGLAPAPKSCKKCGTTKWSSLVTDLCQVCYAERA